MSNLTVLRAYAQKSKPETLPASILFTCTPKSLAIFDAYPKSIFHFLILPRLVPPLTVFELTNLRSLLKTNKDRTKEVILELEEHAKNVKNMIEDEMMSRYGFKWGIWTGFHAVPSMEHVHLHVISNDLCSQALKKKKHYNSFHPKLGFFIHLEQVLEWLEAESSYYITMSNLKESQYEPLLKEDFSCWRCGHAMKNLPTLKAHLQEEWDKEAKKERAKSEKLKKTVEERDHRRFSQDHMENEVVTPTKQQEETN